VASFWPWKKRPPAQKTRGIDAQTLADIARGMQHAVNATQELCEQHYARMVERYFNDDGTAIMRRIILPHGAGEMEVPMIAIMPPSGLMLKEADIEMAVRIDSTAIKSAAPTDEEAAHTRTSFAVSFTPRAHDRVPNQEASDGGSSAIDIKMHFKAGDPPEGVARIIEAYANTIIPHEIGKLPPPPSNGGTGDGDAPPEPQDRSEGLGEEPPPEESGDTPEPPPSTRPDNSDAEPF
jgi:hypothetical protein